MSEIKLTKDTDKVLCILYKEYLSRIKNGIHKRNALIFTNSTIDNLFPNQDIDFELDELSSNNFIEKDILGDIELESQSIIFMENRLGNTIDKVIDYISKLKP